METQKLTVKVVANHDACYSDSEYAEDFARDVNGKRERLSNIVQWDRKVLYGKKLAVGDVGHDPDGCYYWEVTKVE